MDIQVGLLGRFQVSVGGHPTPPWKHRRAADLIKVLALAPSHRLHREQVMDLFWPDLDLEAAGANLRKAVHHARRTLDSDDVIVTDHEMLALNAEVDVDGFEALAAEAVREGDVGACERAAAAYTGLLLPEDPYASWTDEPRERLRMRHLEVLRRARAWERLIDADPTDEAAYRELMQGALDAGDRRGAIRCFERLRERLRTDLGMGPDEASVAIYEKALAMEGSEPPTSAERARAILAWGLVHLNSGDLEEAERSAEQARALAIEAGLGREVGEASALLGIVASQRGRWRDVFRSEFFACVQQDQAIASFVFDAHLCLAEFSLFGATGHEEIAGYTRELLAIAERAGSVQGQAMAELLLGEIDLFSDRLPEAQEHLTSAAALHEQVGAISGQVMAIQRLAEVNLARGQRWRAGRSLERGLRLATSGPLAPHLVVRVLGIMVAAAKDAEQARQMVVRADATLEGAVVCPPCSMGFLVDATIALARAGELDAARRRLEKAEQLVGMWQGGAWQAAAWEARAVIRDAEGDHAQAVALYKEAADRFAEVNRPRDRARCTAAAAI